jgi:DinB superfamily
MKMLAIARYLTAYFTSQRGRPRGFTFNAHRQVIIDAAMAGDTTDMTTSIDRSRRTFTLDEGTAILSRTPATLDALLRGLPAGWLAANEGGATWSPFDVVGHLVHGEQTDWVPRVKILLEHGEARPFDKFNRLAQFTESAGRTLPELLDEFAALRRKNLDELGSLQLTTADLDKRGRHPELGVVSLRQLLSTWVAHDLDHVVQIARVLARQYSDEVGPWRAYLRIISGQQG